MCGFSGRGLLNKSTLAIVNIQAVNLRVSIPLVQTPMPLAIHNQINQPTVYVGLATLKKCGKQVCEKSYGASSAG